MPDLDRIARAIYRGMGYSAPWGRHPDRVLKMRAAAQAVLDELAPTKPPRYSSDMWPCSGNPKLCQRCLNGEQTRRYTCSVGGETYPPVAKSAQKPHKVLKATRE